MRRIVIILAVIGACIFADAAEARGRGRGRNNFSRFAFANGLARSGFVFVPGAANGQTIVLQNGVQVETLATPAEFVQEQIVVNGVRQVRFRRR